MADEEETYEDAPEDEETGGEDQEEDAELLGDEEHDPENAEHEEEEEEVGNCFDFVIHSVTQMIEILCPDHAAASIQTSERKTKIIIHTGRIKVACLTTDPIN